MTAILLYALFSALPQVALPENESAIRMQAPPPPPPPPPTPPKPPPPPAEEKKEPPKPPPPPVEEVKPIPRPEPETVIIKTVGGDELPDDPPANATPKTPEVDVQKVPEDSEVVIERVPQVEIVPVKEPSKTGRWSHYDHICVTFTVSNLTDVLNRAGDNGWELRSVGTLGEEQLSCFRRPRAGAVQQ